ncbi:beta-fructofuranosidase 1-like [Musa acuminata AAA Group]|uniref:beta-fructofuranosidase 1-like n=1 Tax=Musa acuminata AAA Group TaxID=214697 RepID=UPI0031D1B1A0
MDQSLPFRYPPLLASSSPDSSATRRLRVLAVLMAVLLVGIVSVDVIVRGRAPRDRTALRPTDAIPRSRGPADGVSEKSSRSGLSSSATAGVKGPEDYFQWTKEMLQWQRTAFHFQPLDNWMNDPNAPLFYKGWYHFFYQYNPSSPVWGNITWGHAVSRDLVRWLHLPLALVPDHWYDSRGVWTGSATLLPPDGRPAVLYTGATDDSVQVQNLVFPADPADPLLLRWSKSDANPVLLPPPGVGPQDFRDPTTAWADATGSSWRVAIGTKDESHAGIALVYRTTDFLTYELLPGVLRRVAGTGMWECVDFYPVSTGGVAAGEGLDTSAVAGDGVKHVLKASMDDDRNDYYAIGSYDLEKNVWVPDDAEADVGIGLRYDWGTFYASKTFYDPAKRRRVLWGWVGEMDSEGADVRKGWASIQAIPRTVVFDVKTGGNLIQWPVEEVESLRMSSRNFSGITVAPGSVIPLDVGSATQLDIEAEFVIDEAALMATTEADVGYNCSTSGGAAARGMLGPFGLLVLADKALSEQTAVYFYVARGRDGRLRAHFCQDESRSSKANDIVKRVVGSTVPVLDGEKLSLRILVDHSIVESFAQKGRTCITSRVYPTEAIYGDARVFLFNNATNCNVVAKSLTTWQLNSTYNHPYSSSKGSSMDCVLLVQLWTCLLVFFTLML